MVRHSREDAIDEATFDLLLETAEQMREPFRSECLYILVTGGRLGMRATEICHSCDDWVNWNKNHFRIPRHDPCDHGQDGGRCSYCRKSAKQSVQKTGVDYAVALQRRWKPKTENSARIIPFDFEDWICEEIESFFFHHDCYPHSRSSVNRRVNRLARQAGLPEDDLYPHCLRATAACYHAYRGLPAVALQGLFGWNQLRTAYKYIRSTGGATRRALEETYDDS